MKRRQLEVVVMGRGMAWLDTGTHEAMLEASLFIETIETRQGLMVCCPKKSLIATNTSPPANWKRWQRP